MSGNSKERERIYTSGMARIVERNIQALLERRQKEEKQKTREERIADAITRFTGSMAFVYIHLVLFGTWITWNIGWLGLKPFDPSFVVLAMFASVEAIFLSTFVLISQNRMNVQADKRADLDLQVSLLAEHEITHLITLVTAIAQKLDIQEAENPELSELAKDVKPEKVMDTMEKHKERILNQNKDINV
ncbi:MAG: DUF1003 domain-containing protein [Flavisolibacter sp.]|nr:DUF1003 domain-containing protein [Flavisolibacter sp.]MBD0297002.1 DUF1003 domain-containing protein [Flavisolibacter sp.]MBD0353136.1 DUF1003 domain-containing protein [Flavisolibacter sp.]MBD0366078.1 DUF1003 domain-containing protein [Flavisolibacter sp.]